MGRAERFQAKVVAFARRPKIRSSMLGSLLRPLSYAIPYYWVGALVAAGAVLYALSRLGRVVLLKPLIDRVLTDPTGPDFWAVTLTISGLMAGLAFSEAIGRGLKRYFARYLSYRVAIRIWRDLYRRTVRQEMAFFGRWKIGDLLHRMNDDVNLTLRSLYAFLNEVVVDPLAASGAIVIVFALCWQLASLSLGALVLIVYPLYRLGRHVRKQATKRQDFHARLTQSRVQMLSGFKTIKMFAREAFESDRFDQQCSTFLRKAMRVCRSKTFGVSGTTLFTGLLVALGILLGMLAIRAGLWDLTAGTLVAFVAASQQAFQALKRLTKNYNKLNESLAGSDRIFGYLDATPEPPERTGQSVEGIEPAIAFQHVTFAYADELVLADVSFEAKPGEVVAIVGGSGGGKTTLLDLVARLYRPQSGRITVAGVDIHEFDIDSYLDQIAIVPQEPFLFATTIRDNIAYGKLDATDAEIIEAAKIANIHDFIESLPDGYDTVLGERGETVSGGQRQRIATARAVIKNAKILLLDEATSALDAESEQAFYDALENLIAEGDRTVLVVAHRLSTVTNADRILVLENGRIAERGTHAELLKSGRAYRRLFETQFQQVASP